MPYTGPRAPYRTKKASPACCSVARLLSEHEDFILFDTETTGLSPASCVIIEISALKIRSRDFEILDRLTIYIRPQSPIPRAIERLTGITNDALCDAPSEEEAYPIIADFFGSNTVCGAYNVSFDRGFMEALFSRHGASFQTSREIFDVLKLAKEVVPSGTTPNYKLATMFSYFQEQGKLSKKLFPENTNGNDINDGCGNAFTTISFHNAEDDTLAMFGLFDGLYHEALKLLPEQSEASSQLHAVIRTVARWEGPGGRSRIYVNLKSPYGTVYYDLNQATWANKDYSTDILSMISLDALRQDVFARTGAATEADLWKFTGKA